MTLTDNPAELAIWDWIEERASTHLDEPALLDISGSSHLSFAELAKRISALTQEFRELGIGRDTRVAVSLSDGPETLIILLSLMSIAAVLPIHPTASAATVAAFVEKLDISHIVGAHRPASAAWKIAHARRLSYIEVEVDPTRLGSIQLTPHRAVIAQSQGKAGLDDVALYISTSGTTGNSSLVAVTQRSLDRNIATHGLLNGYGSGTRAVCAMSFSYLFAYVRASLPMLRFGGAVAVAPGYRFTDMQKACETLRPTCMTATPTIIQKFIADAEARHWRPESGVLQRFHTTGEAVPDTLRARLRDVFDASLSTNYGMTEVSPQVANHQPEDSFGTEAAGRIVSPWQVEIVDKDGAVVPTGTTGRITLRGGYVNAIVGMKEDTRFDKAGRILTGDRGYTDEFGVLYVKGRNDDVINRGGEKLDPNTIERSLERDPDVVRAVVFGLPDPKLGQKIFALVILREGATRGARELRQSAGAWITGWGMPERIIVVTEIPSNANGKMSRRDLALRFSDD